MAGSARPPPHDLKQVESLLVAPASDRESLSTILAEALSARHGGGPTDGSLRLYEHIDTEALDCLFEHAKRFDEAEWTLSFDIGDESVIVHSSGFVRFAPR